MVNWRSGGEDIVKQRLELRRALRKGTAMPQCRNVRGNAFVVMRNVCGERVRYWFSSWTDSDVGRGNCTVTRSIMVESDIIMLPASIKPAIVVGSAFLGGAGFCSSPVAGHASGNEGTVTLTLSLFISALGFD